MKGQVFIIYLYLDFNPGGNIVISHTRGNAETFYCPRNKQLFFLSFLYHQLTSVLREVKYLGMMKNPNIPKAALHLYSKQERLYVVRLWECPCFNKYLATKQTIDLFYSAAYTDTHTGDTVVQPAAGHHPGRRAGAGQNRDGGSKTTT